MNLLQALDRLIAKSCFRYWEQLDIQLKYRKTHRYWGDVCRQKRNHFRRCQNNLENLKYELNNRLVPKKVIPNYCINFPGKDGIAITDFFENDEGFYYCSFNKKREDNTARIYLTGKNKKLSIFKQTRLEKTCRTHTSGSNRRYGLIRK